MPQIPDQFLPQPPQLPELPRPPELSRPEQELARKAALPRLRSIKINETVSIKDWDKNPLKIAQQLGIMP